MINSNLLDEPLIKAKFSAEDVRRKFRTFDLIKYNANPWVREMIQKLDIDLIKFHFRSKIILGHSIIDDLGPSIMVNDSIDDQNRFNFTLAHELGHHIMHKNILINASLYDLKDDLKNKSLTSPLELQANAYAANLLLPYNVLEAQLVTGYSAYEIKHSSGVSIETIKYRVKDFLTNYFYLDSPTASLIAENFITAYNRRTAYNTILKDLIDNSYPVTYLLSDVSATETYEKNQRILPKILQKWEVYDQLAYGKKII